MPHGLDPRTRARAAGPVLVALTFVGPACYVGLGDHDPGAADGAESADDGDDDGPSRDDGDDDGGEPSCGSAGIGPSTQRRLTRFEYDNSIRDLFGTAVDALFVAGSPADGFSVDEKLGRFDANAISPLGTLGLEHYMTAAEAVGAEVAAHVDAVLPCDPAAIGEDECAHQFIAAAGRRIYRRPLTDAEQAALFEVMQAERTAAAGEADGYGAAIGLVVTAMLQSPYFLYHLEIGEQAVDSAEPVALTQWELASRLSFFLWAGPPDDALLDAAAEGRLADPDELAAQAERLVADDRFERTLVGFHRQWLGIDGG
ncbi:MAG TPA: DUF1592 domain-containing protein, partial [Nannocystaceae bacterium]|nr:DUF1592 domain-containing protein [Nannocystaceae bacterium]